MLLSHNFYFTYCQRNKKWVNISVDLRIAFIVVRKYYTRNRSITYYCIMLLIELQRCLGTTYPYFHWLHDEMYCVCCNPDRNIGPGNSFWHYIVLVEDSVPITSISVVGYSLAFLWWVFRWPRHLLVEYTSSERRKIDFLLLKSKKNK